MRWIILSLLICSLRVFGGEPSEVALGFLRGLDGGIPKEEWAKEWALSPFCGPEKLERVHERWSRRAGWSKRGRFVFSSLHEKIDGNLAAVLIGATTPDGPDASEVLSLGLVKKEGRWLLAPVEASFDNTGLGFVAEVKSRVRELERWMATQRVGAITALRESEMARFRKEMDGAVSRADLIKDEPKEVLRDFIAAAESGKTDALIVWQGFLERDELPERDWDRHIRVTRRGVQGKDQNRIWRLLTSRKVMKVIVEGSGDDQEAEFMVGFLSSYKTEPMNEVLNPVRFQLYQTKQGWRVMLPAYFSFADEEERVFEDARQEESEWEDRSTVKNMFHVFEEEHDQLTAKAPTELLDAVIGDLKKEGLTLFLQRHVREVEEIKEEAADDDEAEDDDPDEDDFGQGNRKRGAAEEFDDRRMSRYLMAVKWWGDVLKNRETLKTEVAKLYVEESIALGVLSLPTAGESWKPVYRRIWMSRDAKGWVILPGDDLPLQSSYPASLEKVVRKMAGQFAKDGEKMEEEFLANVLKVVGVEDPKGSAASPEVATKLVTEWRETAGDDTMMNLLKVSAVRKLPAKPTQLLRDLGFVRKGAVVSSEPDRTLGSKAVGRFRGVSLLIHGASEVAFPLMIVVPTQDGYRVLIDIELPFEVNKGIKLMNNARLEDLAEEMSKEDLAAIEALREWHQGVARPVFTEWESKQAEEKE